MASGVRNLCCNQLCIHPKDLLEAELVGWEKGAFTGAKEKRIGKIESAGSGTLFLDEISELDLNLQAKLLRFMQDNEFTPLGSNKAARQTQE